VTGPQNPSEPFLTRWSRLKDKERHPTSTPADPAAAPAPPADGDRRPPPEPEENTPPAAIDLASLPPLDSIGAGSDIRAFLQSGVPAELTKAALRRAWTSDPAIRDFIGIAENQWDFTDPGAIPGFGPIEPHADVAALVRQALGQIAPPAQDSAGASPSAAAANEPSAQPYGIPDRNADSGRGDEAVEAQHNAPSAAAQHADASAVASPAPSRRSHGGALPK
jgi:Protein of unknown function (DUF3306)